MIRGKVIVEKHYTSEPPPRPPRGDGGDGPGPNGEHRSPAVVGVWILLGSITMMFVALASAMIVRRGLGDDWLGVPWPRLLWWNTGILVLSSAAIVLACRLPRHFPQLWRVGTMLGLFFLLGQAFAWRELFDLGIGLATTPGASFFYLFTMAHALHVIGGVVALAWVALRTPPSRFAVRVEAASLYWHFLTVLWIGLLGLFLYGGRL
jgi:cytochrome c oxidase subunit III